MHIDLIPRYQNLRIDSQTNLLHHQSSILGLLFLPLFLLFLYWLHNFIIFDSGLRLSFAQKHTHTRKLCT